MVIDSHQHFWQYNPAEHTWMTEAMAVLRRDYSPEDLEPLMSRAGVQGTVAVQARQSLRETEWLLELSDRYDFIRGVVGWVDLRSPQVRDQLGKFARHPKLRGVRHVIHDEPDDRFMLQPEFLRGVEALAEFGLTYDLLLYPKHLPIAVQLVRQFRRQRFVLDHIAKPLIKAGTLSPWDQDIRALARCENVVCKVSGMVTEAAWRQWRAEDFKPYLDVVFDCFGADRLLFGSDWPVCTLAADYEDVVRIVRDYVSASPGDFQEKIFGRNAAQAYGLPGP